MPYRWTPEYTAPLPQDAATRSSEAGDAPLMRLDIWPHRSLPTKGFVATIALMFIAGLVPVIAFIGTTAFWVLLACMMGALAALWFALRRSDRENLREELLIWHDHIILNHYPQKGPRKSWRANPYWVRLALHAEGGPVEQYLTLKSGGAGESREVELGAFLSPEERVRLRDEVAFVLGALKG